MLSLNRPARVREGRATPKIPPTALISANVLPPPDCETEIFMSANVLPPPDCEAEIFIHIMAPTVC